MRGHFGQHFQLTIFGESHGDAIGMVIDGIPAGTPIDEAQIARHMARRAPGSDPTATLRREADRVRIVSGLFEGRATGTPLCGLIENTNTRSGDYAALRAKMRPGHADYAGQVKYGGYSDPRGGGHFSGRLTAPLVFAGSIARQLLAQSGVVIGAHIAAIEGAADAAFDPVRVDADTLLALHERRFPLLAPDRESALRARIAAAKAEGDSVGGVIECAAVGVPAGVGSPFFGSVESVLSSLLFSIPAVKSVAFGDAAWMAGARGHETNDAMAYAPDGRVVCLTNHNGGVTGGITNGMPIVLRVCIKPTPSIARPQQTVDLHAHADTTLCVAGRHDPCIVPRAAVVVESALAIALCELMMDDAATRALK